MDNPTIVGAVAYHPRVVRIWDGMREYFRSMGPPIDYVLYSNYDQMVYALLSHQIDIAWNTNLAWVKVHHRTEGRCRALAMRDVDAQFTTVIVARVDSGVDTLGDLRDKRLAVGSADSAQASILPLYYLHRAGLDPEKNCHLLRFDLDVGKHGDTGTSELEVLRALRENRADAGALGEPTWQNQLAEGRVDPGQIRPIWMSPPYCHCNFTVLADFSESRGRAWTASLLGMRYEDSQWRELMDLEGLKRWVPAEATILEGYRVLFDAVERQGLTRDWARHAK
jgi:ABC-type phosphate/phosphonate transport system substrate-binding protein